MSRTKHATTRCAHCGRKTKRSGPRIARGKRGKRFCYACAPAPRKGK